MKDTQQKVAKPQVKNIMSILSMVEGLNQYLFLNIKCLEGLEND